VGSTTIRLAEPGDLADLYRICLLTGDGGEDASPLYEDPRLLGEIFAAPYAILEPALAFVAEDEQGVSGYVLGALDTRDFERRLEEQWWPALRERYQDPGEQPETWPERWAAHIHRPRPTPAELLTDYPSHLHIDLLPRTQGQGAGRRLITTLAGTLRKKGSHGVHLNVWSKNTRAIGFYEHIGFTELDRTDSGRTLGMSLR
jgi:ribosomal protein S18 acetylase RimI-like enzyme